MKSENQTSARKDSKVARARANESVRHQASILVLPAIIGIAVGWRIFDLTGDLPLCLVLGCVTFVTVAPLIASMSDRDLARRRQNK